MFKSNKHVLGPSIRPSLEELRYRDRAWARISFPSGKRDSVTKGRMSQMLEATTPGPRTTCAFCHEGTWHGWEEGTEAGAEQKYPNDERKRETGSQSVPRLLGEGLEATL